MNEQRPVGISFFLVLAALTFAPVLCPPPLVAHQHDDTYALSGIRVGDELKAFIKRFPESHCHRRHSVAFEKAELRRDWLEWVDCGSDRNVLGLDDGLGASRVSGDNIQVYATFFHKRLVSVEYLLVDIPYDLVLSAYTRKYGVPQTRAEEGLNSFRIAVWSSPCCRLEIEEVSLVAHLDSLGRLCIGRVPGGKAVRLRLAAGLSDEGELSRDTEASSLNGQEH